MIDETSFKILTELTRDGRSSNARIAKKLGINVLTVAKRVNNLLDEGVIVIKAIPNPNKMGYIANAFIGLVVDLQKIDDICAKLVNNSHISMVVTCFGRFDIMLNVDFRTWEMLQSFVKEELSRIEGINKVETYLVSGSTKRYQGIFEDGDTDKQAPQIDEIDQKLIEELIKHGRPNYADVAGKLSISTSTVSRRVAYLVKEDIIKILAIPNPSKLGYLANAFVMVNAYLSKIDSICEQLMDYSEVHLVARLMNRYDIIFGVHATDPGSLFDFMKRKISTIDGVLNTETLIRGNFLHFSADALYLPMNGINRK